MYAMYNDEKPGKEVSFTYGHTKGQCNTGSVRGHSASV